MPTVTETTGQADSMRAIERLENYTVVDFDVHDINVHTEKYAKYMDEPWKSRMEHISYTDEPLVRSIGGSFHYDIEAKPPGLGDDVKTTTPEGVAAFMDRFNTDYAVLHGHQTSLVSNVPEPAYAAAICSAYNDYILDTFCDEVEGIKASIRVAPQAPHRAAEEIHRLADEKDMLNVHISAGMNGLLGEEKFWPIYEAAAEEGLAIDYHPTYTNQPWSGQWGGPQLQNSMEAAASYNQMHLSHIPSLIFSGVIEEFPDVKHIFLEQGITWLPWLLGRMDKNYERRKHVYEHFSKKPSEYFHENFYLGTQPIEDPANPATIAKIIDMIDGKNTLMYTSDFPHYDFDYPSMLTIPGVDEATERAIFGGNALEVLNF